MERMCFILIVSHRSVEKNTGIREINKCFSLIPAGSRFTSCLDCLENHRERLDLVRHQAGFLRHRLQVHGTAKSSVS